jgi:hypothetical protein
MQSKVAESVRSQTRRAVAERLTKVVESLIAALEIAEQQSGMSVEQMRAAALWSGKLSTIADAVTHDARFIQPLVDDVEKNMDTLLEGWGMPADRNLVANHGNLARVLSRAGTDEAAAQTKAVVAEIKKAIEDESGKQSPPDAPGLDTPLQHWARVSEDYLEPGRAVGRKEFRQLVFVGIESDPSPFEGTGHQALSAEDYLDIMRRKIRRVSQIYGSRYREVGNEGDRIDPGAKALYAEFRSRLTALR